MEKYLITEEWNESDIKAGGRCESHACAYGAKSQKEINEIVGSMERYSPYDYVCHVVCKSAEDYESRVRMIEANGGVVTGYEN